MKNMWHDIRFALRQLRKAPGFTFTAVTTLALGIAATSTILSWISGTLFNSVHGARDTSSMVTIMRGVRSEHPMPPFSYPDFADVRAQAKSFSGMLGYHHDFVSITGTGTPERIYGELVTANYFEVLGVRPILGRSLLPAQANETASIPDAVLGYGLWQSHFGGDPDIVGKTIEINFHRYTIVGVAPKGFTGCATGVKSDIFLPIGNMGPVWSWNSNPIEDRSRTFLNVLAVLRPGVSRRTAQSELSLIMQHIVDRYPTSHTGNNTISLDPLWRSPFGANVYFAGTLPILLALAGVLLLLACANVADLLLVRAVSRRREFAIRLSMGARRWRLVRELMVENLLLALAGGAVAFAITLWTSQTLAHFLPATVLPLDINGKVDGRVLLATFLIATLTAVLSGIVPALRASALSPVTVLKDEAQSTSGGLGKSRLASGLAAVQIALSLVLLICAGLFVRSLVNAENADQGFDANNVLLISYDLGPMGYTESKAMEFDRQVVQRVRALPGVESATLADFSPFTFTIHTSNVMPEGYVPQLHETVEVDRGNAGPGYLHTMKTPLVEGRDFTEADNADAQHVLIVNKAFVDRYWPGQDAIGKRVQFRGQWFTVIGVAGNGKYRRMTYDVAPLILVPLMQDFQGEVILHVRTSGNPMAFAPAVEGAIHSLNSNLPLFNVDTLRQSMQMGSVFQRIGVVFAGVFGLLAMILAAVGVYGVVAYTTKQRTHEIGIRMALGAARADVFSQVLRQGLRLALMGLAAGFAAALVMTRFLRGMLYGVGPADWLTFMAVSIALCVVALIACLLPALRAASIEPMQALRTE
jgi:putative ABC transport system permease protein